MTTTASRQTSTRRPPPTEVYLLFINTCSYNELRLLTIMQWMGQYPVCLELRMDTCPALAHLKLSPDLPDNSSVDCPGPYTHTSPFTTTLRHLPLCSCPERMRWSFFEADNLIAFVRQMPVNDSDLASARPHHSTVYKCNGFTIFMHPGLPPPSLSRLAPR